MELGLKDRRAVITGGTKGIGRAIAEELVSEGTAVAFCARNEEEVRETEASLRQAGGNVNGWQADVTSVADIQRFTAEAANALGGIDILVNNAGGAHPGNFESLTDEDWRQDIDLKLFEVVPPGVEFEVTVPRLMPAIW
jgi:3-oxoacyl-[acyl-carrier protein] reductase